MITKKYFPIITIAVGAIFLLLSLFDMGSAGEDDLVLKIKPANYIMPAAYKVYANPEVLGGRYNLFKAVLKNESRHVIRNLKVEYRIPKYIDGWVKADAPEYVLPGQSIVAMAYPAFDQSITQKNSQSREKAEIRISFGDKANLVEIDESFSFTMMAVQDMAYTDMPASEIASMNDMFENNVLAACFVTSEDPVIQYYTSQIQQKLLQGETAGVTRTQEECLRFMMGIYEATRRSGMVYSSTTGVPANTGDVQTIVQRIRLPRDVVSGNTGLCIELSLLYASIMRNAGMNAVIYFIPGHAYPGFHLDGNYYAIEATGINGAGLGSVWSAEEALQRGQEELSEFIQAAQMGRDGYDIVDINELFKMGIIPMELRDDNFARQKIDEYASLWTAGRGQYGSDPGRGTGGVSTSSGMATFNRGVTFSYPSSWNVINNPNPQLPHLISTIASPQGYLEIYQVNGTNNVWDGLNYIIQVYNSMGLTINYQQGGSQNGYSLVAGMSKSSTGQSSWYGAFRTNGNSVVGLVIPSNLTQSEQILKSLR